MAQLQSTSITGSLIVTQGITGSFSGSISNATSASYAATASYALNAGDSIWTGSAGNIYYNGGNVGIGTTNPATKLQVNGTFASNALWTDASSIGYWGNYSTAYGGLTWDTGYGMIFSTGGNALRFGTNGTSVRMTIDTSGNVGIGTTNPSQKFVVSNGSSEVFKVYSSGEVVAGTNYIYAAYSSGTSFYSQGPASFRDGIHNDTSTYLKIDGGTSGFTYFSGNVGIGTTNPAAKLYVVGSSQNTLALDSPAYPELTFRVSGTVKSYDAIVTTNQGYFNTSTVGDRIYRTEAGNHLFGYSTTEIMRIASGGNVGIGTANPTGQLTVAKQYSSYTPGEYLLKLRGGNGAINDLVDAYYDSDAAIFRVGYAGLNNSRAVINGGTSAGGASLSLVYGSTLTTFITADGTSYFNGGSIGIGITNPTEKLAVNGNIEITNPYGKIGFDVGDAYGDYPHYGLGKTNGAYPVNLAGYFGLTFGTAGSERVTIDGTGNVGIGSTSPNTKLSIVGSNSAEGQVYVGNTDATYSAGINFTTSGTNRGYVGWRYTNSTAPFTLAGIHLINFDNSNLVLGTYNLPRLVIDTNGNVGIGSTSPGYKLDVNGTGRFTGRLYAESNITLSGFIQPSSNVGYGIKSSNGTILQEWYDGAIYNYGTSYLASQVLINGTTNSSTTYMYDSYVDGNSSYLQAPPALIRLDSAASGSIDQAPVALFIHNENGSNNTWTKLSLGSRETSGAGNSVSIAGIAAQKTSGTANAWASGDLYLWTKNGGTQVVNMVLKPSGNVGIGITNPTAPLDTNGVRLGRNWAISNRADIRLDSNGADYPADILFGHTSAANQTGWDGVYWSLSSRANNLSNAFTIWRGAGNPGGSGEEILFTILPNGNVGIGTTTPSQKLVVNGRAIVGGGLTGDALSISTSIGTYTFNGYDLLTPSSFLITAGSSGYLSLDGYPVIFKVSGGEKMRVNTDGNIGIGTTSPTAFLDVKGLADNAGTISLQLRSGNSATNFSSNQITLGYSNSDTYRHAIKSRHQSGSPSGNAIDFYTWAYGGSSSAIGGQHVMSLDGANVGIGVTTPTYGLVVNNQSTSLVSTGTMYIGADLNGGGKGLVINSSTRTDTEASILALEVISRTSGNTLAATVGGNVGIGTTNPYSKLEITSTTLAWGEGIVINPAPSGYASVFYRVQGTSGSTYTGTWALGKNSSSESGGELLQIVKNGLTGGTGYRVDALQQWKTNGDSIFGFKVGIGTTNPTVPLQVNGAGGDGSPTLRLISTASDTFNWASSTEHASLTAGETSIHLIGKANSQYNQAYFGYRHVSDGSSSNMVTIGMYASDYLLNILGNGNVGIGTTTPGYKLEVNGTFGASGTAVFNGSATYINSSDIIVGNNSTDAVGISGNTMYFPGNGNVGIGTTSPSGKLTLSTPNAYEGTILQLQSRDEPTAYNLKINEVVTSGVVRWSFDMTNSSAYNNVLVFDRGNIGIGTTTPAVTLQVDASGGGLIRATRTSAGSGYIQMEADGTNGTLAANNILYLNAGGSTKMTVLSGGNVGIGTTNPAGKLSIEGDGTEYSNIVFKQSAAQEHLIYASANYQYNLIGSGAPVWIWGQQGASERMRLDSTGLGIGTTSPSAKLQTVSSGLGDGGGIRITNSGAGGDDYRIWPTATVNGEGAGKLIFTNNGGNVLTLTSGGNVGIGTTSPYGKFQVNASNYGESPTINKALLVSDSAAPSKYLILTYHATPDIGIIQGLHEGTAWKNIALNPNGGNVGIGTTSIGYKLYVNGTSYFADTIYNGGGHISWTAGYSDGTTQTYNGNSLAFLTNSSSYTVRMFITSGGNVGIGTTSPQGKLEIFSSSDNQLRIDASGTYSAMYLTQNQTPKAAVWMNNGTLGMFVGTTVSNGYLAFGTDNSSEKMRITSAGNVGIGTTSPNKALTVYGGNDNGIWIDSNGNQYTTLALGRSGVEKVNFAWDNTNSILGTVTYGASSMTFSPNSTEAMRIANGGNVGIGTTNPSQLLHIVGTNGANNGITLQNTNASGNSQVRFLNTSGTERAAITYINGSDAVYHYTAGGGNLLNLVGANVGIGTASPTAKLHTDGTTKLGGGTLQVSTDQTFTTNYSYTFRDAVGINNPNSLSAASATTVMSIGSMSNGVSLITTGNVGIGTTSPEYPLDVNGNIKLATALLFSGTNYYPRITRSTNDLQFSTDNAGSSDVRLAITAAGNVGIGVTNPSYKLQVAGTSWFTAEQAISYTDSIQSMYGGTGYSLFRMYGNSNGVEMQIDAHAHNSGAATIGTYSNSDVFIKTNQTNRMVVKAGGNVGIGVTAPAAKLQVSGSTNVLNVRGSGSAVTSSIFSVDGNNGRLFEVSDDLSNSLFSVNTIAGLPVIEAFADYTVTMGTYGAYSLQVTGSRVGVGTSSPGYPLHVSGSVSGISIYATNDIAAFSDQSVKTDLQVIDSAVDRIKQINGYTYVRVDDLSNTRRAGVIAQEVQKVLPEVVSENSDGTLNVAYSNMIALLIEGMKEQQSQIDKLREDLEDLRYEL